MDDEDRVAIPGILWLAGVVSVSMLMWYGLLRIVRAIL